MMAYRLICFLLLFLLASISLSAQLKWERVNSLFGDLPASVQVFRSTDSLDGQPNISYYLKADLKDEELIFTTDTTSGRRLTPSQFQAKHPDAVAVVNCTFFSFQTNQNLGLVIRDGKLLGYNINAIFQKKDSQYQYVLPGSFGINEKRRADIAWVYNDSTSSNLYAVQDYALLQTATGGLKRPGLRDFSIQKRKMKKWKMQTAIAGGPVLVQNGNIQITNNQELKFVGKAIDDRHPRTAVGYTSDRHIIILVVEGRRLGIAAGATLYQEAAILRDLGCVEALNLDGGGSSCLLVNGRETIRPSDKEGNQRPVPAVLLIMRRIYP